MNFAVYPVIAAILTIFATAAYAGFRAAPYVPTFARDVRRMLDLAHVQPGELIVDLGAGDGRFLLAAAAHYRARGLGYEISILPYLVAQLRRLVSPFRSRVAMRFRDFYRQDLGQADVVTCFLTPMAMKRLAPKLANELRPGARVVSYAFRIREWRPDVEDRSIPNHGPVFVYTMPPRSAP